MARVLISMSPEFLDKVDNLANSEQRTRSEYIREALRNYMRRNKSVNFHKAQQTANELEELIG
ncbi:MAG: ribbon-helix-helix domain-containing protein [Candidatus Gastranaerophilales bacterium]|nr:ribbon-helix-helix domain-containing protein [Candidatus Gastranaerophilales bacterium]